MISSDDVYATLLLTVSLTPNQVEYAHPLSISEFAQMEDKLRTLGITHLGSLLQMDISGLMAELDLLEEEAYRIYTLLNRNVQLTYMMEKLYMRGINIVSKQEDQYPKLLKRRMGRVTPPFYYISGSNDLLSRPKIAIMGVSRYRTTPECQKAIDNLVKGAVEQNYSILTGGEFGISFYATQSAYNNGGNVVEVVSGNMAALIKDDETIADMLVTNRAAIVSLEHPDALATIPHAFNRDRTLFSLADAVFILNSDGKHSEQNLLRNRWCDWIYAWNNSAGNRELIGRGAISLNEIDENTVREQCGRWRSNYNEQMSIFELIPG